MNENGTHRKDIATGTKAGAGAAGAGSGTLLVLLANNLPDKNPWKSWLVLLAPSLSIAITIAYGLVRKALDEYLDGRRIKRFVREAKVTLKEALENTNTSEAHRKKLRAQLEELELLLVKASIEKVRVVDAPAVSLEASGR
jgi:hypothetical protein